jgi:histidinol dehydrogenase
MTIPLIDSLDTARATILRRLPFDELVVPQTLRDGIAARFGEPLTPAEAVERVIRDVRQRGDAALREWTQRLDGVELDQFVVPAARLAAAAATLAPDLREALETAATELERFHQHQARNSWTTYSVEGVMGQIVLPLARVGVYVPGGAAPLPSSLLHAAIPARVAGVEQVIVASPPQRDTGMPAEIVLAAASIAGVDQVVTLGGAQAIAALAYGTEHVPQVDKIVGPCLARWVSRACRGRPKHWSLPTPAPTRAMWPPICWRRPNTCWRVRFC